MKKILSILIIAFLLLWNTTYADFSIETTLSAQKQESYKKQIDSIYKIFENKLQKLNNDEQSKSLENITWKIDNIIITEKNNSNYFIFSYLNFLLKDKLNSIKNEIKNEKETLEEKNKIELLKKQNDEINKKRLSSDERPIWTIEITAPNYSYDKEKNKVYEIITSNNLVKWYELYKNLKTWEFETNNSTKLDNWFYNSTTKEIYVAYNYWRYKYIREDLVTISNSFIIKGTDVYYWDSKIWIFYPNQLQIQKQDDIPLTQWCSEFWTDNTINKIYYDKNSKFYNDILNKRNYNYNYIYFCNENEAINAWYKKSLN